MRIRKRISAWTLVLCLLLGMIPTYAGAADSGTCGDNVTYAFEDAGTLTISGTGGMSNYDTASVAPWNNYRASITSVTVESGVSGVGSHAFNGCANLTGVSLPKGLTTIGYSTFRDCTSLTGIALPDTVTTIEGDAFRGCSGLTDMRIPSGVSLVSDHAFMGCANLHAVRIPASVTSVGSYAFSDCSALTDVYYQGTAQQWSNVSIDDGNEALTSATLHYNDEAGDWNGSGTTTTTLASVSITSSRATAYDTSSTAITSGIAWSVTPANSGVTINAEGRLTVSTTATAQEYTVTATPDSTGTVTGNAQSAKFAVTRSYTINFEANGGTKTMPPVTVQTSSYTLPENSFTPPDGMKFKAWSVNGTEYASGTAIDFTDTTLKNTSDGVELSGEMTVTAVWEADTPAVTLDHVTLNPASVTLDGTNGANVTASAIGSNNNAFTSGVTWSVTPSGSGVEITNETTGEIGIAATATAGDYTVTATYENASASATLTVTRAITLASVTLNPSSVTLDGTNGATVTASAIGSNNNAFTSGVTWSVTPSGGGVEITNETTGEIGIAATATAGDYTVTATYENASASATLTVTRAITLASVTLNPSSVTLDGTNGATVTASAIGSDDNAITSGVTWSISPVDSSATNSGLTINATSGAITVAANASIGTYTVTATYNNISKSAMLNVEKLVAFVVTFDGNGGFPQTEKHYPEPNAMVSPPTQNPTRDGYTFKGWFTTADASGTPFDFNTPITQPLTLYAGWQVNAYTVSYYLYENDTEPYQTSTVNPGELHTLGNNAPLPVGGTPQALIAWNVNGTRYNLGDQITVNANLKIVAVIRYTSSYVNIWLNGDGSELDRKEFSKASGANPSIYDQYYSTDKTPIKAEDDEYSYTFREWDNGTRTENTVSDGPDHETLTITITYHPIFDVTSKLDPYRVLERLKDMDGYMDQTWHLAGPLSEFLQVPASGRFVIDGKPLTLSEAFTRSKETPEYIAEEGSTKLSIPSETFEQFGEGTHSIAATFQTTPDSNTPGDDGLRVTSDYYTVKPKGKVTIDASEMNGANATKAVRGVSYTNRFYTSPRLNDKYFRMSVINGTIPAGLTFHDGGYFTGTPLTAGQSCTFTVGLQIRSNVTDAWLETYEDTVEVTIVVEQDTQANVQTSEDPGYELVERLPATIEVDTIGEVVHLTSKGPFEEFTDFYIDGVKQIRNVNYTAKPCLIDPVTGDVLSLLDGGAITGTFIQLQKSQLSLGTHDLNLEFVKTDPIGNKQVRNASQKVTVTQKTTPVVVSTGGGGGRSSSGTAYYSVKASKPAHGSIGLSATSVAYGKIVTVTVTPDKGYKVKSVSAVDSKNASVKLTGSGNKYTFTMPKRTVTVSATFEPSAYTVSASQAQHGKITLNSSTASVGATVNGSTTPDKGYLLSGVTVRDENGNAVKAEAFNDGKFTFLMPSSKVTVNATFTVKRLASFVDIQGPDWFFDDAEWAYNKSILRGMTENYWEPQSLMSSVTLIVTLERLDGVDLTPYDTGADDGIDNNAWYASAQRWARDNNILLKDRAFGEQEAMTRGECAVMLMNYLRYRGLNVTPKSEFAFTDAEQLTPDELNAFRLLQDADVFRGYSNGTVRPKAYLSRAHLSALLHRLSSYIIKEETAGGNINPVAMPTQVRN